jgi:protein-tyrosine-phosphatase
MKNYLFVCYAGAKRSPTAASVAKEIAKSKGLEIQVSYGGIDVPLNGTQKQLSEHFKKYDLVFAMDEIIAKKLQTKCGVPYGKIIDLEIEDIYEKHDRVLVEILRNKLSEYI